MTVSNNGVQRYPDIRAQGALSGMPDKIGKTAERRKKSRAILRNGTALAPVNHNPTDRQFSKQKPDGSYARHMKSPHKRMSRMLGVSLMLGDRKAWVDFREVAKMLLTPFERTGLVVAALGSLPEDAALMAAAAVFGAAGDPLPAFLGGMEDARSWAVFASTAELRAYALAAFEMMTPEDQAAFFKQIGEIEVTV